MRYLLILIGIIGMITYIFMAGPKVLPGQDVVEQNRREAVWERVYALETSRRTMLAWSKLNTMGLASPALASGDVAAWDQGYQVGYVRGYSRGSGAAVRTFSR